jgi:osmotically-inducible protein OsmY
MSNGRGRLLSCHASASATVIKAARGFVGVGTNGEHVREAMHMYERSERNATVVITGADELAAAVANALFWCLAVPRDRVSVTIENGWVTLTGDVERPYERGCAEAVVSRVPGIVGVINRIVVHAETVERAQA